MAITIGPGINIGPGIVVGAYTGTEIITFTSSGNLNIPNDGRTIVSAIMLLVAGGGAGGYNGFSGGGGAGGVLANIDITSNISSGGVYPVVVGNGSILSQTTSRGGNTSAFGYTAIGGVDGTDAQITNLVGGSGGGARYYLLHNAATQGTPGQGHDGGDATVDGYTNAAGGGGGGGGAGSPGGEGNASSYGHGGIGIWDDISGVNTYYAQGGDGGYPNHTPNLAVGYGSGGSSAATTGYDGTSGQDGICIIRYTYTV